MSFAEPDRLWWLLVLPLLVWWSLPPKPRQVHWTPHWAAVQRALAALQRRPPRRNWLRLWLLLLATAAAVLAHAGPRLAAEPGPTRLVVVLDGSQSMAAAAGTWPVATAANGTVSRWQRALALLRERLAAVPPHVDVTLVRAGGPLLRRSGAWARAALDLGQPAGPNVDLAALVAQLDADPDTAIWTLTDGQGHTALPEPGALSLFGDPADNAAFTAARLVDHWPLPELAVELEIVLAAAAPQTVTIDVAGAAVAATTITVALQPGERRRERLALARQPAGGDLLVRLRCPGDALPDDDLWQWRLPPLPAPAIAVLAAADAGPYAQVAAQALADELGGQVVGRDAPAVGMLLVDGGEVGFLPGSGRALCFGARQLGQPRGELWLLPPVVDWDRQAPLLAGLDLSGLRVEFALRDSLPPGQPILFGAAADGSRQALAVVAGGGARQSVHFAFRLADSNLPLLPAFPQLLRRAFVVSHGEAAQPTDLGQPPPAGEGDLRHRVAAADRPLPPFGSPPQPVAGWLWLVSLACLALRAWCR